MKWDLDLWYEMWDRAGSQGLDTWYPVRGKVEREGEPDPVRVPNVDGLGGTGSAPPVDLGGHPEGE